MAVCQRKPDEKLYPQGRVEIFVTRGKPVILENGELDLSSCEVLESQDIKNIIVNQGKDVIIKTLALGVSEYAKLTRLSIGDLGTIPSDPTVPKTPLPTRTELYHEVYRADAEAVVLNVNVPGSPDTHEIKLVKTFTASDIPITAFTYQAKPVINEVGMISINPAVQIIRDPVAFPNAPMADEKLFAIRTFKSVPFERDNDISVTFRYSIYID